MGSAVPLAVLEAALDASGVPGMIEALLPIGVRPRQLAARTLLIGMQLTLSDRREAHLTQVHAALLALPEADQHRLGVITTWKTGPHQLTYRQVEHTFATITAALSRPRPDGAPSDRLQQASDQLLEATIPAEVSTASSSLAADWTDLVAWARAVPAIRPGTGTDPEARWGHRNVGRPVEEGEMFFGYYLTAATMVADDDGSPVPELTRRIIVASSEHDPAALLARVLTAMPAAGIPLGDIIADSGFSHRVPATWADPLRTAHARLVHDLHPTDRGPHGTHQGAIIALGNLYCPATPPGLLDLGALPPGADAAQIAAHDQQTAELARYKLGLHAAEDADGTRRHACPAAAGKLRCPLRAQSMTLTRDRPEILAPPEHPPACCTQQTITAGPHIAARTRQKHDYPSAAWRVSYNRRTAAERYNSSIKDRALNDISRGWIRLMGVTTNMLWITCLTAVRNHRILDAFNARHPGPQPRRHAAALPAGP